MPRRKQKMTPLERLVKANTTKLKNLRKKRIGVAKDYDNELDILDGKMAEVSTLLKQLKK